MSDMRAALCKRLCHFTTCLPQSQFLPELTHIIIPFRGQRIHQLVNLPFQRTWFRLPQVPLVLAGRIGTQNHRPRIFHECSNARPHSFIRGFIRGWFSLPQSQFLPELTHIIIPFRGQLTASRQLVNLPFQRTWFRLRIVTLRRKGAT